MNRLVFIAGVLLQSQAVLAGTIESQKDNVQVFALADKSSAVIQKLKKGEKLSAGERTGMYWQVKTSTGKDGYVSILAVKMKPDENLGLSDAMREAVKKGRSKSTADGARTRSSVMGVRGLDDTREVGMASTLRPNFHAVYSLEDFEISPVQLAKQGDLVMAEIELKAGKSK